MQEEDTSKAGGGWCTPPSLNESGRQMENSQSLFERGLHVPQRANIWLINLSTGKSRALELHRFRPELACLFLFANLLSQ